MLIWARRTSASMIGGNVRCPWYLLLAQAASAPDNPMSYAEMNLADRFAYLSSNASQFEWRIQIKYHTV
jgi:hypothetical protein